MQSYAFLVLSTAIRKPQANHCGLILCMRDICKIIPVHKLYSGSGEIAKYFFFCGTAMANMNEAWLPNLSREKHDNLSKQHKGSYSSARQSGQKICAQQWHQNVLCLVSSPLRHFEKKAWQELCGRRLCALRCCPLVVGDGWTGWWRQAKAGPCSLPLLPHQYFARDIFG